MKTFLKIHILLFLMVSNIALYAQQENVWVFANSGIDFNATPPVSFPSQMGSAPLSNFGESAASVADANGVLQFYTEGTYVFNRQHQLMPNGDPIIPVTNVTGYSPTSSTAQGSIIIPHPDTSNLYYVFSLGSIESGFFSGRLYYSVVDMDLDNGLGDVVSNRRGILVDSNLTERITAVPRSDCQGFWLLCVDHTGMLKSFSITGMGINTNPVVSNLNLNAVQKIGKIDISPNGQKIGISQNVDAVMGNFSGLILADFNASDGTVSNVQELMQNVSIYGLCFDFDSELLYLNEFSLSPLGYITQINVNAGTVADINNSRVVLSDRVLYTSIKRAPNNKIYYRYMQPNIISVINAPNVPGTGAGVQDTAIVLNPGPGTVIVNAALPNIVPKLPQAVHNSGQIAYSFCDTIEDLQLVATDSSGGNYIWSDGVTGTYSRMDLDTPGVYWVNYTTGLCTNNTDTFIVNIFYQEDTKIHKVVCSDNGYDHDGNILISSGSYIDTFRTINGCDSIVTLELELYPSVEAAIFLGSSPPFCLGDSIFLSAANAPEYEWLYNGESLGKSRTQSVLLSNTNNTITLITRSNDLCEAVDRVSLEATECCQIIIPTAFSPNGDGLNDVFSVKMGDCYISDVEMQIFDRWGQTVYYGRGGRALSGWDGVQNGIPVDLGVYFYTLKYKMQYSKDMIVKKGDLTLIR